MENCIRFKLNDVPFYKQSKEINVFLTENIGVGAWGQVFACQLPEFVVKVIPIGGHLFKEKSHDEEIYKDAPTTETLFKQEANLTMLMGKHNIGAKVFASQIIELDKNDKKLLNFAFKDEVRGKCKFGMILMERLQYNYEQYSQFIKGHVNEQIYKEQIKNMVTNQAVKAFRLGFVHADLHSGENIMIDIDSEMKPVSVKIIDWGITTTPEKWFEVSINSII